jgi:hypothetical protein
MIFVAGKDVSSGSTGAKIELLKNFARGHGSGDAVDEKLPVPETRIALYS